MQPKVVYKLPHLPPPPPGSPSFQVITWSGRV